MQFGFLEALFVSYFQILCLRQVNVFLKYISFFIQAAAQCYIDLIIKESDNNVKLIVLDRLIELKEHPAHERVLQVSIL